MLNARGMSLIELLFVLCLMAVIGGMAVPMAGSTLGYFRLSGDARNLSNGLAVTKMRAASNFSQARLYVDLAGRSHHMDTLNKTTGQWTPDGGSRYLSTGVTFGFGAATNAPVNTQAVIGQAPLCQTNAMVDIANTACVIFNSRGVPVDSTGAPTGIDALYVTDGSSIYGMTVSATGMIRSWRAVSQATASWTLQ